MPNVLRIGGYLVYFWTNENLEPIHVHISEGKPTENATKIWLTKAGGAVVASNGSRIPTNKLNKILEVIIDNHFYICLNYGRKCLDKILWLSIVNLPSSPPTLFFSKNMTYYLE